VARGRRDGRGFSTGPVRHLNRAYTGNDRPRLTCTECGQSPEAVETWRIVFADIGEAAIYFPDCAAREFGSADAER